VSPLSALTADLLLLNDALSDSEGDVEEQLNRLLRDAQISVPSCVGLSVTVETTPEQFTLVAYDDPIGPIHSLASLCVTLPGRRVPVAAAVTLILVATVPGAFVDLAADLAFALGLPLSELVLDQHLGERRANATNLADLSAINQAIGMLIGRGAGPAEARVALQLVADSSASPLADAARAVLISLDESRAAPAARPAR
jgi:hypothetical protein